ncbi:MAG: TetR/AcrR family transcriptional regulator [Clostridium sp.]|jgi:hypothetical protein|uniref:TetR/AcrR family transcriptional regulator n=1 Tax=Clostridium sp. TaxID=1506 RepID=UPI0025C65629|nr:TetR/AcrR family transcriptional regulator [Clostridium sp.]MCH3963585.1 TetR/AcrR family transcriptional regulator [Clostridium sp.]MCI1714726.1 TetR/AcrR family transcriptional regulator [Clostridium sp.]MCI1799085.1 TetR/AcrR family transcriptional regulator [Clostridium sp.]MCI1812909.1 TetR/AcrR family transcriptional regulator [Clostridium sp.]MCI1869799.1 TetR/AcrR family transcriptional regulator [Clostridium sp.]
MNGFEKRRKQKQESILSAALELFKQKGPNKTSITDIADLAHVSESSVYNFYTNKENLKKELIKKIICDDYLKTINILENSDCVLDKLKDLLVVKTEFFINFSWYALTDPKGEDFISECIGSDNYLKYTDATVTLIEKGKSEGVFDATISTKSMLKYLDIIRYYFINNPALFNNDTTFSKEIYMLFLNAFIKKK